MVGIDRGVRKLFATNQGWKFYNPRYWERIRKRYIELCKSLSRKVKVLEKLESSKMVKKTNKKLVQGTPARCALVVKGLIKIWEIKKYSFVLVVDMKKTEMSMLQKTFFEELSAELEKRNGEDNECHGGNCNTCQKRETCLDTCDSCQKGFCYECLGRIENGLYCDGCYREKESLKKTDKIIKTAKEVSASINFLPQVGGGSDGFNNNLGSRKEYFHFYNQIPKRKKYNLLLKRALRKTEKELKRKKYQEELKRYSSFTLFELGSGGKPLNLPYCDGKFSNKPISPKKLLKRSLEILNFFAKHPKKRKIVADKNTPKKSSLKVLLSSYKICGGGHACEKEKVDLIKIAKYQIRKLAEMIDIGNVRLEIIEGTKFPKCKRVRTGIKVRSPYNGEWYYLYCLDDDYFHKEKKLTEEERKDRIWYADKYMFLVVKNKSHLISKLKDFPYSLINKNEVNFLPKQVREKEQNVRESLIEGFEQSQVGSNYPPITKSVWNEVLVGFKFLYKK
ncbi:10347_t:CDS:2 [Funneliformis geosporum]|nr:10347_t:CDS:2 [Funneliformis geosporum]